LSEGRCGGVCAACNTMAGQTSPVGINESLLEAKTLWIGDLAYWCDEAWLTSLFAGASRAPWARVSALK